MIKIVNDESETINEINDIIIGIFEILKLGKPVEIDGEERIAIEERAEDYEDLLNILSNLLEQKTNIKNILEKKKYSLSVSYIKNALKGLDLLKDKSKLYKTFLENLYNQFDGEISLFTFIMPLNIIFDFEYDEEDLENVLELFGLKKLEINNLGYLIEEETTNETKEKDLEIRENKLSGAELVDAYYKRNLINVNEVSGLLEDFHEVVYVMIEGRDLNYAYKKAISNVEAFLGYISFINHYLGYKEYFGYFEEFNFNKITYDTLLFIQNNKIIAPPKDQAENVKKRVERTNERINEDKFKVMVNVSEDYMLKLKESFKNILNKSFSLYYSAISEKSLDYSFLKFWTISEQLAKTRQKDDIVVLEIFKSFVNPYFARRIDFLVRKRNHLVHRGDRGISSNDRDLAKILTDLILIDAIRTMATLNGKKDYDNYLLSRLDVK
ncbi:hypothetical protein [Methanobacterium sp. MBAC-LM]|uniref:hypothetical protein n=1 Tax=Methanobacterium sp. MBAC-LM TaxID=3412034 RepID=UPI003C72AED6